MNNQLLDFLNESCVGSKKIFSWSYEKEGLTVSFDFSQHPFSFIIDKEWEDVWIGQLAQDDIFKLKKSVFDVVARFTNEVKNELFVLNLLNKELRKSMIDRLVVEIEWFLEEQRLCFLVKQINKYVLVPRSMQESFADLSKDSVGDSVYKVNLWLTDTLSNSCNFVDSIAELQSRIKLEEQTYSSSSLIGEPDINDWWAAKKAEAAFAK